MEAKVHMITLVVSDLHLGARNSQAASIAGLLEGRFDRLILNGDTINNLNFKKFKPKHWRVLSRLQEIARSHELILIRGNHDGKPSEGLPFGPLQVLAKLIGVPLREEYELETPKGRYLVLHGDRFDPTLNWPVLTDTADWCYGAVQKINKKAAKWLKRRVKRLGGVVMFVKQRSVLHAKARGFAGIIAGHTHFCDDEWIDGVHYLNSGCWVEASCSYVRVDSAQIKLCHWDQVDVPVQPVEQRLALQAGSLNGHTAFSRMASTAPRLRSAQAHNGVAHHASMDLTELRSRNLPCGKEKGEEDWGFDGD
jgi:UDP-2,3-diacylglucosamine pyrophosphatase LpxH